ncbi:hypothetical protein SESBI_33570 [Sesbania bispinosa]|nr:hypothetical protein SESBI_33570 [Sesbania bispinosa]
MRHGGAWERSILGEEGGKVGPHLRVVGDFSAMNDSKPFLAKVAVAATVTVMMGVENRK